MAFRVDPERELETLRMAADQAVANGHMTPADAELVKATLTLERNVPPVPKGTIVTAAMMNAHLSVQMLRARMACETEPGLDDDGHRALMRALVDRCDGEPFAGGSCVFCGVTTKGAHADTCPWPAVVRAAGTK